MQIFEIVLLILFGGTVSVYGSIIGAGGGFLMVPMLLIIYTFAPNIAAGTSLAVVCVAGVSATYNYVRQRRIDYKAGWVWALFSFPGSILGASIVNYIDRRLFSILFALLLLAISLYLFIFGSPKNTKLAEGNIAPKKGLGWVYRKKTDSSGKEFEYQYNLWYGSALSFAVGFVSSMSGIGGGIIYGPVMISVFRIPVHITTATSQFILLFSALVGSTTHAFQDHIRWEVAIPMAIGAIVGGQIGSRVSQKIKGKFIVQGLVLALVFVGVRLLFG